jgi:hypothetical protein
MKLKVAYLMPTKYLVSVFEVVYRYPSLAQLN